jgi:hypothetical protein
VNHLLKSVVREIRTLRSVGTGGGRPPPVTRWAPSNGRPYRHHKKQPFLAAPVRSRNSPSATKTGCFVPGTDGSNPSPSSGESGANLIFGANAIDGRRGDRERPGHDRTGSPIRLSISILLANSRSIAFEDLQIAVIERARAHSHHDLLRPGPGVLARSPHDPVNAAEAVDPISFHLFLLPIGHVMGFHAASPWGSWSVRSSRTHECRPSRPQFTALSLGVRRSRVVERSHHQRPPRYR